MNRYISDLHFGHKNIIRFDGRPFVSADQMEKVMTDCWNNTVDKDDTVYILGDFCWGKEPEWIRILDNLKGNKVLVRGNHDLKQMSKTLKSKFLDIKDYKEIQDGDFHLTLCHYPILCYKRGYDPRSIMLYGHVHTTEEYDRVHEWTQYIIDNRHNPGDSFGELINVGCMMPYMEYCPRTLCELLNAWAEEYSFGGDKNGVNGNKD